MTKLKRGSIFCGKNHGRHNGGRTTIRKREMKKISLTLNYGRKGKQLFIPTNITHFLFEEGGGTIMKRWIVWGWRGRNQGKRRDALLNNVTPTRLSSSPITKSPATEKPPTRRTPTKTTITSTYYYYYYYYYYDYYYHHNNYYYYYYHNYYYHH